mmetsp:Transcript_55263/g.124496  ORF Transcript_55263/g.124496 Transcript_55263/m.124496 type:complete len:528 (-) Transcript_55263:146-1729(-)|eukprot:CAMPEP_0197932388 /NCGR_PEP_ID=MMETSP1439-20131203/108512_1 /TAXON_ID=66791 /ORGANISM="Gonyaulax spinifera, Strain CCMP409" /LENGTH=527 /DNA_ID=CAMNT_0043555169 /DNA_START=90 /DNA_END=1673 /DNA_ORIENTATION=-
MAAESDELFKAGDFVRLEGMPDASGLEGFTGSLVKPVGKGRWVVAIDGKDKSSVVNSVNLRRLGKPKGAAGQQAEPPTKVYNIVGTWDDWEPHKMTWNAEKYCFEYKIVIGSDGVESFKFLVGGDWDACVFPSRSSATLHDGHEVSGPSDGGLEADWAIGQHQGDQSHEGASFLVRVFLEEDGAPKRVHWELLGSPVKSNDVAASKPATAKPKPFMGEGQEDEVRFESSRKPRGGGWSGRFERESKQDQEREEDTKSLPRGNGDAKQRRDDAGLAEKIVEEEKQARERLARRLAAVGQAVPAITDGVEVVDPEQMEKDEVQSKLYENRRRYLVMNGSKKEKDVVRQAALAGTKFREIPGIDDFVKIREKDAKERAQRRQEPGLDSQKQDGNNSSVPTGPSGPCVECGKPCGTKLEAGDYCCSSCWQTFAEILKEGWEGTAFCNGLQAAQRVRNLVNQQGYSSNDARRAVMDQFPEAFGRAKKKEPKEDTFKIPQRCSKCGQGVLEGINGRQEGGFIFCTYCDPEPRR